MKAMPDAPVFALTREQRKLAYKQEDIAPVPLTRVTGEPFPFRVGLASTPALMSRRTSQTEGMAAYVLATIEDIDSTSEPAAHHLRGRRCRIMRLLLGRWPFAGNGASCPRLPG